MKLYEAQAVCRELDDIVNQDAARSLGAAIARANPLPLCPGGPHGAECNRHAIAPDRPTIHHGWGTIDGERVRLSWRA